MLAIKNISKKYPLASGSFFALKDVSLNIQRGEIIGLLGGNGAGKTTLSSIIATIHPPTTGDILFNGVSIYKDIYQFRKTVGFCPQQPNLDAELTVRQNLEFAGRYFLMPRDVYLRRVDEFLTIFELTRYEHFKIDQLSGGNRQRVSIARALMHNPQLVLLDEPTVGLDPDIRRKLWDLILKLKQLGITVVLTTHYLDEAEYLCDRVCILKRGAVQLIETVATLRKDRENKKFEDIFLELVQTDE